MYDRDRRPPRSPVDAETAAAEAALDRALAQAVALGRTGRVPQAMAATRTLAQAHPRNYRVLGLLGVLYGQQGDTHHALYYLTEALACSPPHPVELLTNLALIYAQADAPLHALQTWHSLATHYQRVKRPPELPDPATQITALHATLPPDPALAALAPPRAEEVRMAAERAHLRLLAHNPLANIESECRAALRYAPRYAAPLLTLAQAQFLDGQPALALATLAPLQTASPPPHAAAAWATYAYWAGRPVDECRAALARVDSAPARPAERAALAAAWGLLGDDAVVLQLLAPDQPPPGSDDAPAPASLSPLAPRPVPLATRLLAAAQANSGQPDAALELLRPLRGAPDSRSAALLAALEHEAPVPGSDGRYPYLAWDEVLPLSSLRHFLAPTLTGPRAFWQRLVPPSPPGPLRTRLLAAYPRLAEVAALLLWAGDPALESLGVRLLLVLDTPEARQVLSAHLYGRAGSYAGRQEAGYALVDLGALPNGSAVAFWTGTDWSELRLYRLTPGGIYPARQEAELAAQLEVVSSRA